MGAFGAMMLLPPAAVQKTTFSDDRRQWSPGQRSCVGRGSKRSCKQETLGVSRAKARMQPEDTVELLQQLFTERYEFLIGRKWHDYSFQVAQLASSGYHRVAVTGTQTAGKTGNLNYNQGGPMFQACDNCGKQMLRSHRTMIQRLVYAKLYKCTRCQTAAGYPRAWTLHFSLVPHCPRCGTERLSVRRELDKIDSLRRTPIGLVYRLLGARLYHCHSCRLQFYDLRKPGSDPAEHLMC